MAKTLVFSDIYDEFYPKISYYLNGLVGQQEAEELTQIVFEKISRNVDSFRGESKLCTWIYRIATNTALDRLKSSSFRYSQAGSFAADSNHMPGIEAAIFESKFKQASPDKKIVRNEQVSTSSASQHQVAGDMKVNLEDINNQASADLEGVQCVNKASNDLKQLSTQLKALMASFHLLFFINVYIF